MVKRHVLTYKDTPREKRVYEEVEKHSGKSVWIKNILSDYIEGRLMYIDDVYRILERFNIQISSENKDNSTKNQVDSIDLSEFGSIFDK